MLDSGLRWARADAVKGKKAGNLHTHQTNCNLLRDPTGMPFHAVEQKAVGENIQPAFVFETRPGQDCIRELRQSLLR